MAKSLKAQKSILIPTVEEVPRISNAERKALRASLKKARADIAAGDYDVVTAVSLRREFDDIFDSAANGANLFAMSEPLSPAGEALWDDTMAQIERDRKKS